MRIFSLLCLLGAWVSHAQCGNPAPEQALANAPAAERDELRRNWGRMASNFSALEADRTEFLKTKDPTLIFPALYYHATKLEMERISRGEVPGAAGQLALMNRFYDAWRFNKEEFRKGGADDVEPWWYAYFSEASTTDPAKMNVQDLVGLMAAAATAHVEFDLPRAIRDQTAGMSPADVAAAKATFQSSAGIFRPASEGFAADANRTYYGPGTEGRGLDAFLLDASTYVTEWSVNPFNPVDMRNNAWNVATSRGPIPTEEARQPTFPGPTSPYSAVQTVTVPANSSASINVPAGARIYIQATGRARLSQFLELSSTPAGVAFMGGAYNFRGLESWPHGALIGYFPSQPPFLVGRNWNGQTQSGGRLQLRLNDKDFDNNTGSYSAIVCLER